MHDKKYLFIGYGDIAQRLAKRFACEQVSMVGVARTQKSCDNVTLWQGAIQDPSISQQLQSTGFDVAVITLTPSERGEQGYRDAYLNNVQHLVKLWQTGTPPGLVVLVSSTSVYGQAGGEWVDEHSETVPERATARILLETEQALQQSGIPCAVVRFSGIYGPGRDHLLRQVKAGKPGNEGYTNRIHADDCAGVIAHLIARHHNGQPLKPIYLATDCAPVTAKDVRQWLAGKLGVSLQGDAGDTDGGKRCSNALLLADGYQFIYPSYKEGYRKVVDAEKS